MNISVSRDSHRLRIGAEFTLRIALAAGFLSAVADRFGFWGAPGTPGVAWGDWSKFLAYTEKLNWFAPAGLIPVLGLLATIAEIALAILLLTGIKLRESAFASAALLLCFAVTMTLASSIKGPLDYSVFTAAAAAFYLGATTPR